MIIINTLVVAISFLIGATLYLDRSVFELLNRANWPDKDAYNGVAEFQTDQCRLVTDISGACEDGVVDESTGLVYFACGDMNKRKLWYPPCNWWNGDGVTQDTFHVYDPETKTFEEMDLNYSGEFVSHGISILEDPRDSSKRLMFAVNHKSSGSVVSVFSFGVHNKTMTHIGDIEDSRIHTPNSVDAFVESDGSIGLMCTNDHLFSKGILRTAEELYGPFLWGDVGYCTLKYEGDSIVKESCSRVEVDTSCPNGLTKIPETNEFLVTDTRMGTLRRYLWSHGTKQLHLMSVIPLGVGLDNVRIIPGTQDAVLAGFPNMSQLAYQFQNMDDEEYQVETVALRVNRNENYTVPHVLHKSDGQFGVQVLTTFNYLPKYGTLLGGSVSSGGLLLCELSNLDK